MKRFLGLLATGALALSISSAADAQVFRGLGAGALILDDNLGHKVTITAPVSGTPEWTAWQTALFPNLTWSVPVPPSAGAQSGFLFVGPLPPAVAPVPGSATEVIPNWLSPGVAGFNNNGGTAGAWDYATPAQLNIAMVGAPLANNQNVRTNGAGALTNGPIALGGGALEVTGTLPVANGGTGQTAYTDGQLLIGNTATTGLTKAALTPGTGISVTNGNGSITVANTGVISVTGTAGRISLTGTAANPIINIDPTYVGQNTITTLGTVTTGTWNGTPVTVPFGGTGATTLTGVVKGTGVAPLTASLIVDADVAAAAAIAGTKISPNFGAQNVLTTGTLGAGASTLGATTATSLNSTPIGNTTASSGTFTTLTAGGAVNINQSTNAPTNLGGGTGVVAIGNATGGTTIASPLTLGGVLTSAVPTSYLGVNGAGLVITSSLNVVTGSGTLNTLPKWNPAGSTLIDSKLNDNGTTLNYNAGKFTVDAATGSTAITNGGLDVAGSQTHAGDAVGTTIRATGISNGAWSGFGAFGGTLSTVVLGQTTAGAPVIGAHNATLSAWVPLSVNPAQAVNISAAGFTTAVNGALTVAQATTLSSFGTAGIVHNAAGGLLSSSPVALATADVSGVLPIANGGTNTATAPNANSIVLGNGAGTAYTSLGSTGTATTVLHGNAAGAPTFGAVSLTADVTGVLPIANGGTNSSTALAGTGAIMVENGTSVVQGPAGSTTTLLHGNAAGLPTYGQVVNADIANTTIDLTAKVTGVLPIANGGTNSGTALSASAVAVSNGTALVQGPLGTTTTLLHGNAAGLPTYGQVVNADIANTTIDLTAKVTGVLPVANGGTNSNSFTGNTITVSNAGGTALVSGPAGTTTTVLHGNGAGAPSYGAVNLAAAGDVTGVLTVPNGGTGVATIATNGIVFGNGVGAVGTTAQGASNTFLRGNGAAAPTFGAVGLSTADVTGVLPIANGGTNSNAALTASAIAVSNGTQLVQGPLGTTTTVLHGNAAGLPTYASLNLTTDVTGVLPVPNGGTGTASLTTNAVPYGNGVAAHGSTGASTVNGQFLQTTLAGGAPTWATTLGTANGGTGSSTALVGSKIMISNAAGTAVVEANGISTNNASTTLTATSDITSSAGNLVSGKAPNTAGNLKLFDATGRTATIQTGTPLSFPNQTYTIRTNPGANTSTFALLEIPQTFTATQAVNAAIQSGTVGALDANNSYVAAAATDIAIGLTVNSIASSAVGGKNKGIVVNANNALGAGSDNIAIEIQSGRFVSSGTPATNANGMDLLTSTTGTGAALGISLANANGIISSVTRQGINSTSSSTTNGDYAVKGQVSTAAASTALVGQVDGVVGENLNQVAIGGAGQTADGNVAPAANGYRYAPSGVLAHGNASVTAGVGQYSTAIVIKDGAFAVSGIQPAGHITGKTFAVAPGTNVPIKNPLCTADSYILITPASATAATASLYISTVNDGSFVVTNAAAGSAAADANFNYFIINPVSR